ncbi:MAG: 50S ribosomal protein L29 [Gammaproteobacteria bacterium]|nr:50S ribosomal protein L29 [Gammaproteobacteria bacterium]
MKSSEYLQTLRSKGQQQLKEELAALRREQFSLRMQAATGQLAKTSLISDVRKKIARLKTLIRMQQSAS